MKLLYIFIFIAFNSFATLDGKNESKLNIDPVENNSTGNTKLIGNKYVLINKAFNKPRPLVLTIKNLASPSAPVIISVYGINNKFPVAGEELRVYRIKPRTKILSVKITDLAYGTYAIATYQDVNKNGEIDQNFIGVPKEPYAFSQNYKPVIKAPTFKDCSFVYNEKKNSININMIK